MKKRARTYNDFIRAEPDPETVRNLVENATPELLEAGIRAATDDLIKKPMSDVERALLVMERKEFRAALAILQISPEQSQ